MCSNLQFAFPDSSNSLNTKKRKRMTPEFVSVLALRKLARVNFDGERVVWFLRFFIPNMEPAHDIQAYPSLLSDGNLTEV
jgi:hypothetical protein